MATRRHDDQPAGAGAGAGAIATAPQAKKARAEDAASPWASLPEELVTEVLLRLPARSLARFRCVRRSWDAEITSPGFVERHHTLAAARPKVAFVPPAAAGTEHRLPPAKHHKYMPRDHQPFGVPFRSGGGPRVVGAKACRGLVLVERRRGGGGGGALLSVCNLSTGGRMELPPMRREIRGVNFAGIGFHSPTGEYKVVVHLHTERPLPVGPRLWVLGPEPELYGVITLGADRDWRFRRVPREDWPLCSASSIDGGPVFADGYLHWMYQHKSRSDDGDHHVTHGHGILSFSLADESFRQAQQPDFSAADLAGEDNWSESGEKPVQLAELGGRLCLVRDVRSIGDVRGQIQIWRLEDYDAGWWSLDYSVDLPAGRVPYKLMWPRFVVPLSYLSGGNGGGGGGSSFSGGERRELLLATTYREVLVYDPCTNTVWTVASVTGDHEGGRDLPERIDSADLVLYQESLVRFQGMRYGDGGVILVELVCN